MIPSDWCEPYLGRRIHIHYTNNLQLLTIAKQVGSQARAIAIHGIGAAPGADMDLTIVPDLSVIRVATRSGRYHPGLEPNEFERASS